MRHIFFVLILVMVGLSLGQTTISASTQPIAVTGSEDQEYLAVQDVIGTAIDARTLIGPVMNATGSAALSDSALLGATADEFAVLQNHPARMMDAIQRRYRSYGNGGTQTILMIETLNEQTNILDLYGLPPQGQTNVITRIRTRPLASSYLRKMLSSATIQDNAGLFTSVGKARIAQAAEQANINVLLITSSQQFSSIDAWRSWLHSHAGNSGQITIGVHINPKSIYVIPGSATHLSVAQAYQGFLNALPIFNSRSDSAVSNGVIKLIEIYHEMIARG